MVSVISCAGILQLNLLICSFFDRLDEQRGVGIIIPHYAGRDHSQTRTSNPACNLVETYSRWSPDNACCCTMGTEAESMDFEIRLISSLRLASA